jgi:UDP-N-acetylmuramoyl-tripeptide--D-alanyl-D-alanine ligase
MAVVTTIGAAHLQFFPSIADIAAANAEVFFGLEPGGTAVLNADHDYLHILFGKAREARVGRVVTYGFDDSADWNIERLGALGARTTATIRHGDRIHMLNLGVHGRHMVSNAIAGLVVSDLSGEGVSGAIAALDKFAAPEGKGEAARLGPADKPLVLLDESDNANLASVRAALEVFAGVKAPGGRKLLVLGDMLELGPQGAALHASLKDAAINTGSDKIFLVGTAIEALNIALGEGYVTGHASKVEDLSDVILSSLAHGDAVMVKGSNGVRLGTLVAKIRETFG